MSAEALHPGEPHIDLSLVRRLLAAQFPAWARLPLARFPSAGTVNAVFRLGDGLSVRLPRQEYGVGDAVKEHTWLPRLAPHLPVAVPEVVGRGEPGEGYPWRWSVHRWLDGATPHQDRLPAEPTALARDLGDFITALRRAAPSGVPGAPLAYRGGPLATVDDGTRAAIEQLKGLIDQAAATAVWERALAAPRWTGAPVWVHSDLMPGNLLVDGAGSAAGAGPDGAPGGAAPRLTAVIDFGTLGVGDPACDLIPAWNLLPAAVRDTFRTAAGADDAMWERGRGWALSMALIQLPYYQDTLPAMAANARHVIHEVLTDQGFLAD